MYPLPNPIELKHIDKISSICTVNRYNHLSVDLSIYMHEKIRYCPSIISNDLVSYKMTNYL